MSFGIYVHIPYCLQRCHYCDFTTFEHSEILPPDQYLKILLKEIKLRSHIFPRTTLTSLYFGGGTPSLIPAEDILALINELANYGFTLNDQSEITIEINPATIDEKKLDVYLGGGINRFSVGAQTFNDALLHKCGRKHSSQDTRNTLQMLKSRNLNYSFDLLFALPTQTLSQLKKDLEEIAQFDPPHLSAYCLTLPQNHPLSRGRPPEGLQLEMFDLVDSRLDEIGLKKYEISNYAQPGKESQHNCLYWTHQPYWGIGISAHSYLPPLQSFSPLNEDQGIRFWNYNHMQKYLNQMNQMEPTGLEKRDLQSFSSLQIERLKLHEALTDFCHTSLRMKSGLNETDLKIRFGPALSKKVMVILNQLIQTEMLKKTAKGWNLTHKGERMSNQIFLSLTFDQDEINDALTKFPDVSYLP